MADINNAPKPAGDTPPLAAKGHGRQAAGDHALLHEFAELLFFAYRDFIADPDAILAQFGFGRAHHRVLHFIHRYPGLRVADLLEILKITKQSLGRVLKALIDQGYVDQRAGHTDRRERLLHATEKGRSLAERLAAPQRQRLATALDAGLARTGEEDGREVVRRFLCCMIGDAEREKVDKLFASRSERLGQEE